MSKWRWFFHHQQHKPIDTVSLEANGVFVGRGRGDGWEGGQHGVGCFGSRGGQEQDRAREGLTGRRAIIVFGHRRGFFFFHSSFFFSISIFFLNIFPRQFCFRCPGFFGWDGWLGLGNRWWCGWMDGWMVGRESLAGSRGTGWDGWMVGSMDGKATIRADHLSFGFFWRSFSPEAKGEFSPPLLSLPLTTHMETVSGASPSPPFLFHANGNFCGCPLPDRGRGRDLQNLQPTSQLVVAVTRRYSGKSQVWAAPSAF